MNLTQKKLYSMNQVFYRQQFEKKYYFHKNDPNYTLYYIIWIFNGTDIKTFKYKKFLLKKNQIMTWRERYLKTL